MVNQLTLRAARVNKGLSIDQAAYTLRISESTLFSWEMGRTFPRVDDIDRLLAFYGLEYEEVNWRPARHGKE